MDIDFIINELGEDRQRHFGAMAPPIYQSSNFCSPSVAEMRKTLGSELRNPFYTRGNNPTVEVLRTKVAALEGGEDALIFASGSASIAAAVCSQVKQGDHIVCVSKPYTWTNKLLTQFLHRFGVTSEFVDSEVFADRTAFDQWTSGMNERTKLFMLESPNSITFEVQDLSMVAEFARANGIKTVCDNSYASPLNQQPLKMGIDIVCHSASKYLAGHSDMVAGVLVSDAETIGRIFNHEFMTLGGIISPNDAWLMIRGLRTLPIRMNRVAETTPQIVQYLETHPKVERVIYPFSESFPQFELATRQQKRPTGLFTVQFKAPDIPAMERMMDAMKRFYLACSWGGFESLAFPMVALYESENYSKTELPWNMVRFYAGLEEPDVLIKDFEQALELL